MEKTLILLRGLPGSGKTTVAKMLSEGGKYPVIAADDFFFKDGEYIFNPQLLNQAHGECQKRVEESMGSGVEKIFVHNTLTTQEELDPYYELAKKYGYIVVSLVLENRHGGISDKSVPEDTLRKMKDKLVGSIRVL